VRDAFINAPTTSNMVSFVRHDVASDVNAAAAFTEGGATPKAESTIAFDNDEAPVRTIATTVPITDQIMDDEPGLESMVNITLMDFLKQNEDDDLLNGSGVTPELKGLLNTSGIQVADDTYFASNPVQDAGTNNEDLNRLTAALTLVREVGLATPSFVIVSPAALDYMLSITNAQRDYLAGSPFSTTGIPRFRGLPVFVSNKIADDHAVVGDGRLAAVRDRMAAKIDVGYVDKQFTLNQKTLGAVVRLAFAVYRPAAFVDVTLTLA
jgi:HK97 family phage major capsid protein